MPTTKPYNAMDSGRVIGNDNPQSIELAPRSRRLRLKNTGTTVLSVTLDRIAEPTSAEDYTNCIVLETDEVVEVDYETEQITFWGAATAELYWINFRNRTTADVKAENA